MQTDLSQSIINKNTMGISNTGDLQMLAVISNYQKGNVTSNGNVNK